MSQKPHYRSHQLIKSFEAKAMRKRSTSEKIADSLTSFFGSMLFLVLNLIIFVVWILINSGRVPGIAVFDPFPYVLLITLVSLEAIVLTTIVLMSQNRQSKISTLREEMQLQVELITEREISKVLKLINKQLKNEGIEVKDPELNEMLEAVDTSYIEHKLTQQMESQSTSLGKTMAEPVVGVGKKAKEEFKK